MTAHKYHSHLFIQTCAHKDCMKAASFPAPKTHNREDGFYYFCLEHVRNYNAQWNYLRHASQKEIDQQLRYAIHWERPTWPMGKNAAPMQTRPQDNMPRPIRAALKLFSLIPPCSTLQIKTKHRELAKKYHPDSGHPLASGDKFHALQQALNLLQKYFSS